MSGLDLTNESRVRRGFVLPSAIPVKRTEKKTPFSTQVVLCSIHDTV